MTPEPRRAVIGDRLCPSCGYNLVGQDIVREEHYEMLIIRCPECGRATSVQEYPSLARWGRRLSMILVGLWMLFAFALWIATGASIGGMAVGAGHIAGESEFRRFIDEAHDVWAEEQLAAAGITEDQKDPLAVEVIVQASGMPMIQPPPPQAQGVDTSFATWWSQQDPAELIAAMGGWSRSITWMFLWMVLPIMAVALTAGCLWATLLARLKRLSLTLMVPALLAMSLLVIGPLLVGWAVTTPWSAWDAAPRIVGPPVIAAMMGVAAVALWIGLMVGRPLARIMVGFALPPRMSGWLEPLWSADGKTRPQ